MGNDDKKSAVTYVEKLRGYLATDSLVEVTVGDSSKTSVIVGKMCDLGDDFISVSHSLQKEVSEVPSSSVEVGEGENSLEEEEENSEEEKAVPRKKTDVCICVYKLETTVKLEDVKAVTKIIKTSFK